MPNQPDPSFLAILAAINSARSEAAEQLRRSDARLDEVERSLRDTVDKLDSHIKDEEDELKNIADMLREHIAASASWRQKSDAEMAANTAVTQDVKNGQNFVRIATAIVKWVGALALALGSIWWGVRTVLGGSDITPGPGP